jgi:predicted nucleotidyltransferase
MTDDVLRPRLDRLKSLAKSLNEVSDEISKVVQGVEAYLSDQLRIGVTASVLIEREEDPTETICFRRELVYGRFGPKFRLYVAEITSVDGGRNELEQTPWANCPRDMKLLAFQKLPELLDELAVQVERLLDQVDVGYDAIQAMIPIVTPAKAKAVKP